MSTESNEYIKIIWETSYFIGAIKDEESKAEHDYSKNWYVSKSI